MDGARIGRLSLRLDAIYCVVVGLTIVTVAPHSAELAGLPVIVLMIGGLVTGAWGAFVWWSVSHHSLRWSLRVVMFANLAASSALALTGVIAGSVLLAICAAVLCVDVAAFAASQAVALRRMRPADS